MNQANSNSTNRKNKYFGTDGFRGKANVSLTSMQAYRVGRFLGWYYSSSLSGCKKANHKPRIVIGKDTRRSSYTLEYSLVAGITASGADAYMLHVTTTPSISYVTRQDEFDCGVMITASHNPFYDNGIKIINKFGEKIDDNTASLIEMYIDGDMSFFDQGNDLPFATDENIGCIVDYVAGRNRYVGYLISIAAHSYKNLRIGLDCANGASWMIAKAVFDALGAQVYLTGASPNGININLDCGSTKINNLIEFVEENHLDVGFAFDGDADRCIAIDKTGEIIDGDKILYILATRLKSRDMLNKNTVVATIMSNTGLIKALEKENIKCVTTSVGDRFIYECMQKEGYSLGGEQSGHIILQKYATTGDGILTAIMLTEQMCDKKTFLSELSKNVVNWPQREISLRVNNKMAVINNIDVNQKIEQLKTEIGDNGRILLRASGTEPVIRVMAECKDENMCSRCVDELSELIKRRGLLVE